MSVGTAGQASKGMDYSAIFRSVCTNYTTKSLVTLQRNFRQMHPSFRFVDPFVDASPKQEALLQFMSLQRIFSTVTADFTTPILVEQRGPLTEVKADVHFEYVWNRGAVTKLFLPEKTIVEATVEIMVDTASGLVVSHTDHWHTPSVPVLPSFIRRMNATATNGIFRLLGYGKELAKAEKDL